MASHAVLTDLRARITDSAVRCFQFNTNCSLANVSWARHSAATILEKGGFQDGRRTAGMTAVRARCRPVGLRETNGGFRHKRPFKPRPFKVVSWSEAASSKRSRDKKGVVVSVA